MGGYELIFPTADQSRNNQYEVWLKKSQEIWDEFFVGKNKKPIIKE